MPKRFSFETISGGRLQDDGGRMRDGVKVMYCLTGSTRLSRAQRASGSCNVGGVSTDGKHA